MLIQELQNRLTLIKSQIHSLEQRLSQYPDGNLYCHQNGKYIKKKVFLQGQEIYISKKDTNLTKQLAEKKYFAAQLQDLQTEEKIIISILNQYEKNPSKVKQLLDKPAYRQVILSSLTPLSEELAIWSSESYDKNPSHPAQLRFPCTSGNIVRSKSEVLIDQALFTHQIPYRYECLLKLDDIGLYPDFTIRHPETGQYFIWEHFGKMDSASYAQNAFQKMNLYNSHGYIPTVNLITTFETMEHPLTTKTIETIIQHYFG